MKRLIQILRQIYLEVRSSAVIAVFALVIMLSFIIGIPTLFNYMFGETVLQPLGYDSFEAYVQDTNPETPFQLVSSADTIGLGKTHIDLQHQLVVDSAERFFPKESDIQFYQDRNGKLFIFIQNNSGNYSYLMVNENNFSNASGEGFRGVAIFNLFDPLKFRWDGQTTLVIIYNNVSFHFRKNADNPDQWEYAFFLIGQ